MGWGDWNPVSSGNRHKVSNKLESAWDTTRGIADDVYDYGKQMSEDLAKANRQVGDRLNPLNYGNYKDFLKNPTAYGRGVAGPIFGNDGDPNGGIWDKYGQWLAPVALPYYLAGSALNIGYDYDRTGDEDAARDQARQVAATGTAAFVAPNVYEFAGSGYPGAVAAGTTAGGLSALGSDSSEENDVTERALVGGLAGGVGHAVGGVQTERQPIYNDSGEIMGYQPADVYYDNTLELGKVAGDVSRQAVQTTYNMELARQQRQKQGERYADWQRQMSQYLNNLNQGTVNKETLSSPEIEEKLLGVPSLASLGASEDSRTNKKPLSNVYGSSQYQTPNSQIEQGYSGSYIL